MHLEAISNELFYFSHREQVNDPLDCNPPIRIPSFEEFNSVMLGFFNRSKQLPKELKDLLIEKKVARALYSPFEDYANLKKLLKEQAGEIGLLCLSKDFENPLMWSHYSNGHRGFCVGYDIQYENHLLWDEIDFLNGNKVILREVEYSNSPISTMMIYEVLVSLMLDRAMESGGYLSFDKGYEVFKFENISRVLFQYLSIFFLSHKHRSWSYEQEVRILSLPTAGEKGYGLKSPKKYNVKRLYLGAKMPDSQRKTLSMLLSNNDLEIYEAYFSDESLGLNFRQLR
tara:strand:- start:96 stop:950 length:855 start_codon:yes stop_codon:yes gene_type:complete